MLGDNGKGGSRLCYVMKTITIKGIVKDMVYLSHLVPTLPLLFMLPDSSMFPVNRQIIYPMMIKWKDGVEWKDVKRKIQQIQQKYESEEDDLHINFESVEEMYDKHLQSEHVLLHLLMFVAGVCVVISVFGIFGMVRLDCDRKRKRYQ